MKALYLTAALFLLQSSGVSKALWLKPLTAKMQKVVSGEKVRIAVRAVDSEGHPVSGIPIAFSLELAPMLAEGAYISNDEVATGKNGLAWVYLFVPSEGTYQVGAKSSSLLGSPYVFTVEAKPPRPPAILLPSGGGEEVPPLPPLPKVPSQSAPPEKRGKSVEGKKKPKKKEKASENPAKPEKKEELKQSSEKEKGKKESGESDAAPIPPALQEKSQGSQVPGPQVKVRKKNKKTPGKKMPSPLVGGGTSLEVKVAPAKLKTILLSIEPKVLRVGESQGGMLKIKGFDLYGNPCQQDTLFTVGLHNLLTGSADAAPEKEGFQARCVGGMAVLQVSPEKKAGEAEVVVQAEGLEVKNSFRILPGEPASITFSLFPSEVRAGEPAQVKAEAFDQYGNPLSDPVAIQKVSGPGALKPTGVFVSKRTGEVTLEGSLQGVKKEFAFSVQPGAAAVVQLILQGDPIVGREVDLVGKAVDRFANPIPSVPLAFSLKGEGSVASSSGVTNALGEAKTKVELPKKKEKIVLKAASGSIQAELPLQLESEVGSVLRAESLALTAGSRGELVLKLEDRFGNPVDREELTVTNTRGVYAKKSVEVVQGEGKLIVRAGEKAGKASLQLAGEKVRKEVAFTIEPAAPAKIALKVDPNPVVAGGSGVVLAEVLDHFGNRVGEGTKVSVKVSSGSLQGEKARSFTVEKGELRFVYTAPEKVGVAEIRVQAGGTESRYRLQVVPGEVASLEVDPQVLEVQAGQAVPISVKAFDKYGNRVEARPTFEVEGGGSVDGKMHFRSKRAGVGRVKITQGGVTKEIAVKTLPGSPHKILASLQEKEVRAGELLHIQAKVVDQFGNGVGNVLVYCYVGRESEAKKALTDAQGMAVFAVRAPTSTGEIPIRVVSPQVKEEGRVPFEVAELGWSDFSFVLGQTLRVRVKPGAVEKIQVTVEPSEVRAGDRHPIVIRAKAEDAYGNIVAEPGLFTFFVQGGKALTKDSDQERAGVQVQGEGEASLLLLPSKKAGKYAVRVQQGEVAGSAPFAILGGAPVKLFLFPQGDRVVANGQDVLKVKVAAKDEFGNPASEEVTLAASRGGFVEDSGLLQSLKRKLIEGEAVGLYRATTEAGEVVFTASSGKVKAQAVVEQTPGALDHIVVTPASVVMKAGEKEHFEAKGYDAFENETSVPISWGLVGFGEISMSGDFEATKMGKTTVVATADGIAGRAEVQVEAGEPYVVSLHLPKGTAQPEEKLTFEVQVRDKFSNPVAGAYVLLESLDKALWFPSQEVQTNGEGTALIPAITPKEAGLYRLRAQVKGIAPALAGFRVEPGEAAGVKLFAHPKRIFPGEKTRITAEVRDAYGNFVNDGTPVRFAATFGTFDNGKVFQEVETKGGVATTQLGVRNDFSEITVTATAGGAPVAEVQVEKGKSAVEISTVPELVPSLTSPPPPSPAKEVLQGGLLFPGAEQEIAQMSFKDADIRDVLNVIARKAGINVVVDEAVKERINLQLSHITAGEAFQVILASQGLQFEHIGNTIVVKKSGERVSGKRIELVSLSAAQAPDVAQILKDVLPDVNVAVDKRSNALILSGSPEVEGEAKRLISVLDTSHTLGGYTTKVFVLQYADAQGVADILKEMEIGVQQGAKLTVYKPKGTGLDEKGVMENVTFSASGGSGQRGQGGGFPGGGFPGGGFPGVPTTTGGTTLGTGVGFNSFFSSGKIRDPQSARKNVLIVYDTLDNVKRAEEIVAKIDQPAPQVLLDVRLEEVDTGALKALGTKWDSENITTSLSEQNPSGRIAPQSFARSALQIGAILSLLKQKNQARTVSAPRLATVDGKTAQIFIGDTIFVKQEQLVSDNKGNIIKSENFTPMNVGIMLNILPRITDNGLIAVNVFVAVATPKFQQDPSLPPTITGRSADTFVRLKEGQTMVIGGLITNEETDRLSRVPLLSEAPIIGNLFKWRRKEKKETELLVFLTPHVVNVAQP